MSRPKRKRNISRPPIMEGFKPFGIAMKDLEPIILLFEEYEAIRLKDYEGLSQLEASEKMNVSRPTLTRIYESARSSISKAFIEGKAIFIEGGNYEMEDLWYRCNSCKKLNIKMDNCKYCNSDELISLNQ